MDTDFVSLTDMLAELKRLRVENELLKRLLSELFKIDRPKQVHFTLELL